MASPAPVPIANPMSVFRPRCPGFFSSTRRMSCRESISWLVVALIASDSAVTRSTNPRMVFPAARVTRISDPATSWLRLAQFAIGLACWAAAAAARTAANKANKQMRFNRLVMEGLSGHYASTHVAPISSVASPASCLRRGSSEGPVRYLPCSGFPERRSQRSSIRSPPSGPSVSRC